MGTPPEVTEEWPELRQQWCEAPQASSSPSDPHEVDWRIDKTYKLRNPTKPLLPRRAPEKCWVGRDARTSWRDGNVLLVIGRTMGQKGTVRPVPFDRCEFYLNTHTHIPVENSHVSGRCGGGSGRMESGRQNVDDVEAGGGRTTHSCLFRRRLRLFLWKTSERSTWRAREGQVTGQSASAPAPAPGPYSGLRFSQLPECFLLSPSPLPILSCSPTFLGRRSLSAEAVGLEGPTQGLSVTPAPTDRVPSAVEPVGARAPGRLPQCQGVCPGETPVPRSVSLGQPNISQEQNCFTIRVTKKKPQNNV